MTECPVDLKPMADWVQENDPTGFCRECVVGPVVQWYTEELDERDQGQLVQELTQTVDADDTDYAKICGKLDEIKGKVDDPLKKRLLEFDCAAQTFNPDNRPG